MWQGLCTFHAMLSSFCPDPGKSQLRGTRRRELVDSPTRLLQAIQDHVAHAIYPQRPETKPTVWLKWLSRCKRPSGALSETAAAQLKPRLGATYGENRMETSSRIDSDSQKLDAKVPTQRKFFQNLQMPLGFRPLKLTLGPPPAACIA